MATKAHQQYFADEISIWKEAREFSLITNLKDKLDGIEPGAQENVIEAVKRNGTELPIVNKAVDVSVPEVIDNLSTTSSTNALSANMGKVLYDYLHNMQAVGRFLSLWNSSTGLATSNFAPTPYTYVTGDYYIVGTVASGGGANLTPTGATYDGTPSQAQELNTIDISDIYLYDGTQWLLLSNSGRQIAVDSSLSNISANPVENRVITNALTLKANDADISLVGKTNDYNDLSNLPTLPDPNDLNTKTFYLADDQDTINATAAYNWYSAGKNPIIIYNDKSYSIYSVGNNELQFYSDYRNSAENSNSIMASDGLLFTISNGSVSTITNNVITYGVGSGFLSTQINYVTPYAPLFDGSPATKKYVDDSVSSIVIPTVGDGTITINQGVTQKGTFTTNQNGNTTITLDAIPTNTSDLNNDSGFITTSDVGDGTITINQGSVQKGTFTTNQSGNTTVTLDAVPTNVSQLNNDSNFITAAAVGDGTVTITQGGIQKGTFTLNQSGNTTIALDAGGGGGTTPGDGTITINQGSIQKGTFTVNQAGNTTINLDQVPTNTSDLVNDDGFITSASVGNGTITINQGAVQKGTFTTNQSGNSTVTLDAVPTNTSDLNNDSGFITNTVNNLTNYYDNTEVYNKTEIDNLISNFGGFEVVASLPSSGISVNKIYLLGPMSGTTDTYEEYVYISGSWVKIGETTVDLTNYFNKSTDDSDDIIQGNSHLFVTQAEKTLWNGKANVSDIKNATINFTQGGVNKGSFTLNQSGDATIALDEGSTPGNGTIYIRQGGVNKGSFTVNQSGNTTIDLDAGGGGGGGGGGVTSVNGKTGAVLVNELPSGGSSGDILTKTSTGYAWMVGSNTHTWVVDSNSISSATMEEIVQYVLQGYDYGAILKDTRTEDIFIYSGYTTGTSGTVFKFMGLKHISAKTASDWGDYTTAWENAIFITVTTNPVTYSYELTENDDNDPHTNYISVLGAGYNDYFRPQQSYQPATKGYVDAAIIGGGGGVLGITNNTAGTNLTITQEWVGTQAQYDALVSGGQVANGVIYNIISSS